MLGYAFWLDERADSINAPQRLLSCLFGIESGMERPVGVLGVMLLMNHYRWATDPRDKVYGLLSIARIRDLDFKRVESPPYYATYGAR
jgi:hypothetical protein